MINPTVISVTQAAHISKYTRQGIHRLIQTGQVDAFRIGGKYMVGTQSLIEATKSCHACGKPRGILSNIRVTANQNV